MGESLISRRGSSDGSFLGILKTEIITSNQVWTAPKAKNNSFSVRIFGGGGGGSNNAGGGGGWMNNGILTIKPGTNIQIIIGKGGDFEIYNNINSTSGGTTAFGSYLSANGGGRASINIGGNGGSGGGGGKQGGTGYQFGGGGSGGGNGGSGGIWGGGGGSMYGKGGDGGTYGGGGGGGTSWTDKIAYSGGNGGTYGGGGGGSILQNAYGGVFIGSYGIGGTYGGNGGTGMTMWAGVLNNTSLILAQNGTNTSTWTNVFHDGNEYFRGWGRAGSLGYNANVANSYQDRAAGGAGGGGFGGNGGNGGFNYEKDGGVAAAGGGGGGYGSNGGSSFIAVQTMTDVGGGGGGGYGGDGGNGWRWGSGGGGGYGKSAKGGNASTGASGGGGGYYGKGGTGGGGGGYGNGGSFIDYQLAEFGGGGGGNDASIPNNISRSYGNGGDGICIIQYYI